MTPRQSVDSIPSDLLGVFALAELAEAPGHGYAIVERIGLERERAGSLYRVLRQLEAKGLVVGTWEPPAGRGPARKVYRLTVHGRRCLRTSRGEVGLLARRLSAFAEAGR